MKVNFIIRGNLSDLDQLTKELANTFSAMEHHFYYTKQIGHATELAMTVGTQCNILVAIGGDGTINEVINGLMPIHKISRPIFAFLPRGTGNDFSRNFHNKKSVESLFQSIKNKKTLMIDIGKATYTNLNSIQQTRYFNNIIDVGIGGTVVKKINDTVSPHLPANLKYFKAIFSSLLTYKPQNFSIQSKDLCWQGTAYSVCIANGKYFGSGMCIAPNAKIDDGIFDVTLIGNIKITDYLLHLNSIKKGNLLQHPEVSYHQLQHCIISSDMPLPIDLDGEFVGYTPLNIDMYALAIEILVT